MIPGAKAVIQGTSRLARVLENLKAEPILVLQGLKALRLTFARRNDHFGVRHFVKEQLPCIQYANPELHIEVDRRPTTVHEKWSPEMKLEFVDGRMKTLLMHEKWSTAILKELMEEAGGTPWQRYKATQLAAGQPIIPGEERETEVVTRSPTPPPSFTEFYANAEPPTFNAPVKRAKKARIQPTAATAAAPS